MFDFQNDVREVNLMQPSKRREGCRLIAVDRDQTSQAVIFTWQEDKTKATLSMREFLPKKLEQMTEAEWKKSIELSVSRLAHIARAYVTDAEFATIKPSGDAKSLVEAQVQKNWLEVTKIIGGLLKAKITAGTTGDTAMKIVLNKNNKDKKYYVGLPKVPPFLSTPSHPKDFSYDPKYDIFEIPASSAAPDTSLPNQGGMTPDPTAGAGGFGTAASGDPDF